MFDVKKRADLLLTTRRWKKKLEQSHVNLGFLKRREACTLMFYPWCFLMDFLHHGMTTLDGIYYREKIKWSKRTWMIFSFMFKEFFLLDDSITQLEALLYNSIISYIFLVSPVVPSRKRRTSSTNNFVGKGAKLYLF